MNSKKNLIDEINLNKEYKSSILRLHNRILEIKLEYLNTLKQHYDDYWLDFDLKCCDLRIACRTSKANFTRYQTGAKRLDEISRFLHKEDISLDRELAKAEERQMQFKKLDPELLAEYQKLKDDLECQDLLIEISQVNMSKTDKPSPFRP